VLEKGFASTSIDELIAAVGITKSGFFYHFKDKGELARYIERESRLFDELFKRADELNEDPLHGFLVALKMMSEMFADLPTAGLPHRFILLSGSPVRQRGLPAQRGGSSRLAQALPRAARPDCRALSAAPPRQSRRCRRYALSHRRRRDHLVTDGE
jgi:AcrR family transcriptional regulator